MQTRIYRKFQTDFKHTLYVSSALLYYPLSVIDHRTFLPQAAAQCVQERRRSTVERQPASVYVDIHLVQVR